MEWTDSVNNYYRTKVLKIIDDTIADRELQITYLNNIIYELQCLKHRIELKDK